jgi:nickel/cobalt exporter
MHSLLLGSLAATGGVVAFFHAALPTHWLPFVLAGRGQRWGRGKTLMVAALAGTGHVLFTIALGVLVAAFGVAVDRATGQVFPWIAAGVLTAFGLYYLSRQALGHGHGHAHFGHGHAHVHSHSHPENEDRLPTQIADGYPAKGRSDRAVILGLFAALTFSPCEAYLPVFVAGVRAGWTGFAFLSAVLALSTVAGMMLLTWLTLLGLERLPLTRLERYEHGVLGAVLVTLAIAVVLIER